MEYWPCEQVPQKDSAMFLTKTGEIRQALEGGDGSRVND